MKSLFFIVLAILIWNPAIAQEQTPKNWTVIISDNQKRPLPVATVSLNHKLYYPINDNGIATVPRIAIKTGDTIYISSLGYKVEKFVVPNSLQLPDRIELKEATFQLQQITVSNKNKGYSIAKMGEMSNFTLSKYLPNPGQQLALYIDNSKHQKGFINNITFFLKNTLNGIDQPFRVRLYNRENDSQFPSKEIMEEIVVRNDKRKTFFKLDISMYGVSLPENGFFVVFELLPKQYYNERQAIIKGNKALGLTYVQYPVPCLAMASFSNKNSQNYSLTRQIRKGDLNSLTWYKSTENFLIEAEVSVLDE